MEMTLARHLFTSLEYFTDPQRPPLRLSLIFLAEMKKRDWEANVDGNVAGKMNLEEVGDKSDV